MNFPILSTPSPNTTTASSTTTTANLNNTTHTTTINSNKSLKRKRTMKSVHFAQKVTVLETYSKEEYDRSEIFAKPIIYKINPKIVRSTPQLSLDIPSATNFFQQQEEGAEGSLGEEEISSAEISPNTPPLNTTAAVNIDEYFNITTSPQQKKKKQRPVLSVNTTMCADPLFFTSLTTNYKHDTNSATTNDDFLVPISATVL